MKELKSYQDCWQAVGLRSLKVKIKSLAEEAKIIRTEEKRISSKDYYWTIARSQLREHRINVVRKEARSALLAYACIRGKDYRAIESLPSKEIDFKNVQRLVDKYGPRGLSVYDWILKSTFSQKQ